MPSTDSGHLGNSGSPSSLQAQGLCLCKCTQRVGALPFLLCLTITALIFPESLKSLYPAFSSNYQKPMMYKPRKYLHFR